jgi:hypothetical protein
MQPNKGILIKKKAWGNKWGKRHATIKKLLNKGPPQRLGTLKQFQGTH